MDNKISLSRYTTLRIGGIAEEFRVARNEKDIVRAVEYAQSKHLSIFPLGGGSNLVVSPILPPLLVLKMENKGIDIVNEDAYSVLLRVNAGTIWDDFVEYTVRKGFSGAEALSMIPGTCGATPVQNVGAYGQEVAHLIKSVRVFDIPMMQFRTIEAVDCTFSYRDSVFKNSLKGKVIIESVNYILSKSKPVIPEYPKVAQVLSVMQHEHPTCSLGILIRKTIMLIRSEKLPDPKKIANVGSFFKNPFVKKEKWQLLQIEHTHMPYFVSSEGYKIPAGWLIEEAGFKGYRKNGVGVYEKNALVLVNESAHTATPLLELAQTIQNKVYEIFGIILEIEPEVI